MKARDTEHAAATPPGERARGAGRWFRALGAGLLAGLVAALAMTLLMEILRFVIGLPSPAEMLGDVFIPSLNLDQFFALLIRFGGGSELKKVGVGAALAGQVVAGTLLGLLYGAIAAWERGRAPGRAGRRGAGRVGVLFVVAVGLAVWIASLVAFRPVLGTNYRGLPLVPAMVVTALGLLVVYATYGVVLVFAYRAMLGPAPGRPAIEPVGRRALVVGVAGAGVLLATGGLLRFLDARSTLGYDGTRNLGPDLRPITPNDRFYTVTKNILDPDPYRPVWRLAVAGLVAHPRTYDFAGLTALGAVEQETTLSCISNDVGDGLVSNAVWTGVPLRQLLEAAGPRGDVARVVFTGVDNYVDTIPLAKALDPTTFVAWAMNGAPLPRRHGYPVRILVPGRFGEKSVKWVTRIELAGREIKGFYERQGWGPTFVVNTLSRFDFPRDGRTIAATPGGAPIPLRGIAFAGDRGVSRVEVSVDGGQTWQTAQFDYQPSRIVWTFWSLAWRPDQSGEYHLAVRAVDGTGAYQTSDRRGITPDGATGYHRITVRVA